MRKASRKLAALAALAMLASLAIAAPQASASHAGTYDVTIGQEFFPQGIPGFSLRFYPGSVAVHEGDTVHFGGDFGTPVLFPEGMDVTEASEKFQANVEDPYSQVKLDPDESGYKFNTAFFQPTVTGCGDAANPCQWDGSDPDAILLSDLPSDLHVTITAAPGSVIYAATAGGHDSGFRIEVIPDGDTPSDQAELDARAAQLMEDDANKAAALFEKYRDRRTSHIGPDGKRVFDVWAGVENGPVALLGMFPRKIRIREGQRVQWHFDYEGIDVHNAVFPFAKARNISNNTFVPVCDPDGDSGTDPDVPPTSPPDVFPPECPPGSELEIDLHKNEIEQRGNGVFTGRSDLETSGLRSLQLLQDGFFSESPWTVRFRNSSPDDGFRYMCTVHGAGIMGGRIVVR
jgi:hypothetical protein